MPIYRSGNNPVIAISAGHPTGIGPEVTLKALADRKIRSSGSFLIIGDGRLFYRLIEELGLKITLNAVSARDLGRKPLAEGAIALLDIRNVPMDKFAYGSDDPIFGKASVEYITTAVALVRRGICRGIVTAPIHKASAQESGFRFAGHTEYLAHLSHTRRYAMMLVGGDLRVTLVTRHIPLKKVSSALSVRSISLAIELTHRALKDAFRIRRPCIGVAGVNPHAGEGGHIGTEEAMIRRSIKDVSRRIGTVVGPRPPDTVFYEAYHGRYDAVVCMYHDQGLIPFKMLHFEDGVNLTLGLPFVRTSPDHGTALAIAGKGSANPASMKEAIRLACSFAFRSDRS